jgi:hypothetical protein
VPLGAARFQGFMKGVEWPFLERRRVVVQAVEAEGDGEEYPRTQEEPEVHRMSRVTQMYLDLRSTLEEQDPRTNSKNKRFAQVNQAK